ncbi:uncharacterized protein LOC128247634 [Octopus bimaculoides]|uniref:uncharacterized protein LOC128247634 n=1 Tax=Octopus bimaculoides TaxID=37653 RepID=UPI0022E690C3|nr:uncharacterized protein LOC128247634 [Octopus bimaculoides]
MQRYLPICCVCETRSRMLKILGVYICRVCYGEVELLRKNKFHNKRSKNSPVSDKNVSVQVTNDEHCPSTYKMQSTNTMSPTRPNKTDQCRSPITRPNTVLNPIIYTSDQHSLPTKSTNTNDQHSYRTTLPKTIDQNSLPTASTNTPDINKYESLFCVSDINKIASYREFGINEI